MHYKKGKNEIYFNLNLNLGIVSYEVSIAYASAVGVVDVPTLFSVVIVGCRFDDEIELLCNQGNIARRIIMKLTTTTTVIKIFPTNTEV